MTDKFILTTSGFILPNNPYYSILPPEKVESNSIFNRSTVISTDNGISDYVKHNSIYTSEASNTAYKDYMADKSFSSYIHLVDIASEVLNKINVNNFFELQANNRNMSPMVFMACLDLYKDTFIYNHMKYAVIPMAGRFVSDTSKTNESIANNLQLLKNNSGYLNTWEKKLASLVDNKDAFCSFFKLVFVDSY